MGMGMSRGDGVGLAPQDLAQLQGTVGGGPPPPAMNGMCPQCGQPLASDGSCPWCETSDMPGGGGIPDPGGGGTLGAMVPPGMMDTSGAQGEEASLMQLLALLQLIQGQGGGMMPGPPAGGLGGVVPGGAVPPNPLLAAMGQRG